MFVTSMVSILDAPTTTISLFFAAIIPETGLHGNCHHTICYLWQIYLVHYYVAYNKIIIKHTPKYTKNMTDRLK